MMASQASYDERSDNRTSSRWVGDQRNLLRWLGWIFVLALVVRGSVAAISLDKYDADHDAYRAIAHTIISSGVYGLTDANGVAKPTAFRPPLYPYLLSWTSPDNISVAILHTLLGAITVVLTFLTALEIFDDRRAGLLASGLVGIDPILLQQSTQVMTETLAATIVAAVLWRWSVAVRVGFRWQLSLQIGVLLSAAYLCRPTFLVWALLIIVIMLAMSWRKSRLRVGLIQTWLPPAIVIALLSLTVGLWMMRNSRAIGHPVWATTHGGYTLLLANNPMFYDYLRTGASGSVWDPQAFFDAYSHRYDADPTTESFWQRDWPAGTGKFDSPAALAATEVSDDRLTGSAAKAVIARQPTMFAWSCLVRVGRLWMPFPHVTPERSKFASLSVGTYGIAFYGLALAGAWRIWRRNSLTSPAVWLPIVAMILTLSAVHAVYWSNLRMRAPAISGLAIVAAAVACRGNVTRQRMN